MTWIFSCDLSMKNMLKFVWLIFGFFFSSIAWLYIQMSIWQPCTVGPETALVLSSNKSLGQDWQVV